MFIGFMIPFTFLAIGLAFMFLFAGLLYLLWFAFLIIYDLAMGYINGKKIGLHKE